MEIVAGWKHHSCLYDLGKLFTLTALYLYHGLVRKLLKMQMHANHVAQSLVTVIISLFYTVMSPRTTRDT